MSATTYNQRPLDSSSSWYRLRLQMDRSPDLRQKSVASWGLNDYYPPAERALTAYVPLALAEKVDGIAPGCYSLQMLEDPMGKKVEDLEGVRQALRQMLPDLQERYGVKSLGVFGSYAHGRQTRRSDVDLLVEFREDAPMSLFKFVALELELGKSLGHKVDLVERNTLKPVIGKRILDEVQPV